MAKSSKTFTFLSRSAPYGSNRPQLCLDAALATAVFEQTVNYIFIDDGVYQLLKDQNAEPIRSKTLGNAMQTLELYGIEQVFVDKESLSERGLTADDLLLPAASVDATDIAELLDSSDYVFNL
ncbi:MAG: sulfurtransferase complex subunit TusC [Pseudomonadales bacterium]|nr:sulfurtransferase complex subunit TusC [Pseudomonadales bacterium]